MVREKFSKFKNIYFMLHVHVCVFICEQAYMHMEIRGKPVIILQVQAFSLDRVFY